MVLPLLSLDDLLRTQATVEDFLLTYPLYHGLELREVIRHVPLLVAVESAIYR